jgi:hypothetical protein
MVVMVNGECGAAEVRIDTINIYGVRGVKQEMRKLNSVGAEAYAWNASWVTDSFTLVM